MRMAMAPPEPRSLGWSSEACGQAAASCPACSARRRSCNRRTALRHQPLIRHLGVTAFALVGVAALARQVPAIRATRIAL